MSAEEIKLIPLQEIVPLPTNVTVIDKEEDMMLRTDMTRIESKGLYKIDPILVRKLSPEEIEKIKAKQAWSQAQYQIVDGHSRFYAAMELGWRQIRARVVEASLEEALAINYAKNKARGEVDPLREAVYFKHLQEGLKMTQEEIAEKFGLTQQRVSQIMKGIKVSKEAVKEITSRLVPYREKQEITGRHLEAIASLSEPEKQVQLVDTIIEGKLSARQAEKAKEAIEKGLSKEKAVEAAKAQGPSVGEVEIGEIECVKCNEKYKIFHVNFGKHKIKRIQEL
jgi:ParB/RepB/Spo0J family partition protein